MMHYRQGKENRRILSSLGFHTFTIFLRLTETEARQLYRDFRNCSNIDVVPIRKDNKNTNDIPKGYIAKYRENGVGVSWYIRFSSEVANYMHMSVNHLSKNYMKEPTPYSVRATINPKIFNGMNDYLSAANFDSLEQVEENYNIKVAEISPILSKFEHYRLNRTDYCFNFNPTELNMGCSAKQLLTLIMRGHVPRHFTLAMKYCEKSKRLKPYKDDFRLKSKSMTISCYWKYAQLHEKFPDCTDLAQSHDVIRFEVKCEYPKMYALSKNIKEVLRADLSTEDILSNFAQGIDVNPTKNLLSDIFAERIIYKYFNKVIRKGDYLTLDGARWMVQSHNFRRDKEERLLRVLDWVKEYGGIAKAQSKLYGSDLSDFKRSLKDFDAIYVNPVTIPRRWGLKHIPNPLKAYNNSIYEEQILHVSRHLYEKRLSECLTTI